MLDNFSALLEFPEGRYAAISQSLAGWEHHQVVKLTGTEGALWASWSGAMDRTFEPTFALKLRRGEVVEEVPIDRPPGEVFELVDQASAFSREPSATAGRSRVRGRTAGGRWPCA